MSVYKRGKYWVVQFNYNKKSPTIPPELARRPGFQSFDPHVK
jgi:hypothetical protein